MTGSARRGRRPYGKADDEKIRSMYKAGKSDVEIAESLGRSVSSATQRRIKLRLIRVPDWDREEEDYLANQRSIGRSWSEIAARLGRSAHAARRHYFKMRERHRR